ncbi:unnamed protein product [Rotaria sordida]|uniref:Uncharacterized protein n=1 Tax=Rotaria sordida TaxID=392033 RepID=A0A815BLJ9_9BILA|nr:unnamed protein product [Rotaria sordida]
MSSLSMTGVRKTRSTNVTSTSSSITTTLDESSILDDLRKNLHCSIQFINIYNQCYQITSLRSSLIEILCNILSNSINIDVKILIFILDCLITNHTNLLIELTDIQFKQNLLPFIKRILSIDEDNNDILLLTLRFLIILIENYSNLLNSTLAEWLSSILHFVVTHISSSSYIIYGDLIIDLLTKIVKNFTPLPKEIVDVLGRSPSSIISTHFLTQLKTWVKHVDDTKLALFAIHLWEPLAALLSRLLTRGHTKGNEMLGVMQDGRACLRDLKDKEHLLLPCFLADHDDSNITGNSILPNITDESQLSQQVDIVTPLINCQQSSSERIHSSCITTIRSHNIDQIESKFLPIVNNINHNDQSDSPVIINKRISSTSTCLTEKQKEKLRTRQVIPLLCDDNSDTQSLSSTMDTPTIESMMATYQLRNTNNENKQSINDNSISLFKQSISNSSSSIESLQENNTIVESLSTSPPPSSSSTTTIIIENENSSIQISTNNNDDDIPEESSIAKKLRRSRRPSTSARKSLINNSKKNRTIPLSNEILTTIPSITNDPSSSSSSLLLNNEIIRTRPLKSILKRLSPTKPRQDHTRHVAFHDQVKVLLFTSPARRDINNQQQKKKSPNKDDIKNGSSIITRRSNLINNNNNNEQTVHNNKTRSSKLFNFSDEKKYELSPKSNKTEESPQIKPVEPIYPALIDCDKPLDSLIHVVYGGVCPTNAINYFRSIKMNTVGDIARSTAAQIEVYPIPPPKLANIQKALSLYQERLINSPSLSPIIGTNGESLTPIASTSEETIAISDGTFTKEASSLPTTTTTIINDPHHSLYDVDTLIDSLDYERLYLNDNNDIDDDDITPPSTSQIDFIRTRRQIALVNRDEQISPQKRHLSLINQDEKNSDNHEQDEQISPKKQTIINRTLGERLQKAADIYKNIGRLPFDDDYIELIRQLFNNSSLTHLEQLHLKSLFLDN